MCDFAIEIIRYYGSLYFARRCFLSVLSNHSWVFPPLFGPAVFPAVRKLRAMMFVVYMFIAIGQQRTFTLQNSAVRSEFHANRQVRHQMASHTLPRIKESFSQWDL